MRAKGYAVNAIGFMYPKACPRSTQNTPSTPTDAPPTAGNNNLGMRDLLTLASTRNISSVSPAAPSPQTIPSSAKLGNWGQVIMPSVPKPLISSGGIAKIALLTLAE